MPYWLIEARRTERAEGIAETATEMGMYARASKRKGTLSSEQEERARNMLARKPYEREPGTFKTIGDWVLLKATDGQVLDLRNSPASEGWEGEAEDYPVKITENPEWFADLMGVELPFWDRPMVRNTAIGLGVVGAGLTLTKVLEWW